MTRKTKHIMSEPQAIINQVDHIAILTSNPQYLFHILTDTLQLPIIWPMKYYGLALSGVVCAGNTNIEVFNYGSPNCPSESERIETNIYAIAFEPTSILENMRELSRRNIPHSPPIPYHGTRFDGFSGKLWTNVALGGFWDGDSRIINISGIINRYPFFESLIGRLLGRLICMRWTKSFVQGESGERALYLTDYTHEVSKTRSNGADNLTRIDGGLIGLEAVQEIVVSLSDYAEKSANWQRLFNPVLPSEPGLWRFGGGPAIRLSSSFEDDIKTIVMKVKSLEIAQKRLAKYDLLGISADHQVSISIPRIQNLDIRLVE